MPAEPQPQLDLRRVRFGSFVARVLDNAKTRRLTIEQIEKATGLGNTTIYAWRDGKWNRDPTPAKVRAFCEGLGASIEEAYRALGWILPDDRRRKATEPLIEDPDVRAIMRKLNDPSTSPAEKLWIRRQIRALAGHLDEE